MKRFLTLLAFVAATISSYAYDVKIDGICYDLDQTKREAAVASYLGLYSGAISIPETITNNGVTYNVTSITISAFGDCTNLTSVTIPNSVKTIGSYAFSNCSSLTSVSIGNSVSSIGEGAFLNCSSLESLSLPSSLTTIPNNLCKDCINLRTVGIPNSINTIGSSPFSGCSISSVNILCKDEADFCNYVKRSNAYNIFHYYIGAKQYEIYIAGKKQTNLVIPNSVTSIGYRVFMDCRSLNSVTIGNSVTSIGEQAFYGCSSLTSVSIPNSVTSIGSSAFLDCSVLTSVTIPNSVTSIGRSAFSGCSGLTSVTIGNSVTSIDYYAFKNCSSLTSVTIGNSVLSINSAAFYGCPNINELIYADGTTTAINTGITSLTSITIPNSVTSLGSGFSSTSNWKNIKSVIISCKDEADFANYVQRTDLYSIFCSGRADCKHSIIVGGEELKNNITIPNSVTSIGNYAFYYCSGLTSVTIPNSVTSIGNYAFNGCTNVEELIYADGTKTALLTGLTSVTSITIPNSVTTLASDSRGIRLCESTYCPNLESVIVSCKDEADFANYVQRTDLESIFCSGSFARKHSIIVGGEELKNNFTIPNSVTNIGNRAFYRCVGLTSVTIPNSVTSIGTYAFYGCSGLTSITIPNSVTSIGYSAFAGCSGLTSITIPNSVTSIGGSAFASCSKLTSVTIPNSVTSIGYNAFEYCSGLTSVTIGNSVTSIGSSAFSYCSGLTSVTIPNSVTSIGGSAFSYCSGLTSVTIPNSVTSIEYRTFSHCSGLTSVTIPNSVTSIGSEAFYGCSSLQDVYCEAETIPVKKIPGAVVLSDTNPFSTWDISSATLHVPASALEAYKSTAPWSSFGTILPIENVNDEPSDITVTPRPTSGNYMFVDYVKAKAKQTVQIPVEVVTEEENIVGFQCNIKLPEGMEFVKNAKGNVVFTWNNDRIDGHTITSKIAADGSVKLVAASMEGATFMETEGVMFYFSATVPEGMEGEQALQLYNVRVSDIDDNEIRCPDMTSVIDVKTYTLGDLNDDGEWSVVDVTMAIKAILDETYIEAGDMNEDGEMSVVDATTIIKYVLNEGPIEKASAPAAKRLKANAIADKPKFVVSPIYVEPGTNNMYLTVDMLNKQEYIGFQTEICLPEGFKFYTNSKGKPTVTLNTDRLETHTATSKLKDERTLRILVASMESDPILDNEGELLRVRVVADAGVEAGNHTATLIDSRVSDDNDIETKLDVTNGYLRVFGEEAISLVVPEGGYATLCLPYDATVPAGLKAYKATGMKNGMVVIEEQTSIAACTPMIIEGTAGTYNFSGDNSDADEFEYSVGSLKSSLVPAESSNGYVLQNLSEGLGFYKIADALTVPSFRCVLDGASVSAAPTFVPVGFEEDANAISSVETAMKNDSAVYTLDGKRVNTMEKGKVYIVGGVKMIVK